MPTATLGIMALYLRGNYLEELPYFQRLTVAGRRMGLDVFVFTPEDVDSSGKEIKAWVFEEESRSWKRKRMSLPDVIYDRCRFQRTYRFQLLRKFRKEHPDLLYLSRPLVHKWAMHQILAKNRKLRIFLPETMIYEAPSDAERLLSRYGVIYLKPVDGTGGRGILRIEALSNGSVTIKGRDRSRRIIPPQSVRRDQLGVRLSKWKLNGRYLVQQGIGIRLKDGRVHDYRLLIQKNGSGEWEVTGCAGRVGAARSITSNLHGGGKAILAERLLELRFGESRKVASIRKTMDEVAFEVVRQVEKNFGSMCEMALDLAVDPKGNVYLLEINPKPAREVFRRIGQRDIYRRAVIRPLEYALYAFKKEEKSDSSD